MLFRSAASARLFFVYGSVVAAEDDAAAVFDPAARLIVRRDRSAEHGYAARLDQRGIRAQFAWRVPRGAPVERAVYGHDVSGIVKALTAEGWQVLVNGTTHRALTRIEGHLHSGIDWFDLEGAAHFGDVTVPLSAARRDRSIESMYRAR